jgi:hypothetical protein
MRNLPVLFVAAVSVVSLVCYAVLPGAPVGLIPDRDAVDLGEVAPNTEHVATFTLRNTGSKEAVIDGIGLSCGCLAADAEHKVVPPGGSTVVRIKWHVGQQIGPANKPVTCSYTSGSEEFTITLNTACRVVSDFDYEPKAMSLKIGEERGVRFWPADGSSRPIIRSATVDTNSVSIRWTDQVLTVVATPTNASVLVTRATVTVHTTSTLTPEVKLYIDLQE